MRKALFAAAAAASTLVAVAAPAAAITRGGRLDGGDHPYVGLMVAFDDGTPLGRCSGTLVSPTVFVTAGHCTHGATDIELWFTSDLHDGGYPTTPAGHGYPFDGEVSGTPYTHPEYVDAQFFLHDLGVVVLDEPVMMAEYGEIGGLGAGNALSTGRNKATSKVTAVGYGLQEIVEGPVGVGPDFDPKLENAKTRYAADLMVLGSNGFGPQSFAVSGDSKHGGTCFGDSGGPHFLYGTNVMIGVTSFGLNGNCGGIGGMYRIDQQDDQDFLAEFLEG